MYTKTPETQQFLKMGGNTSQIFTSSHQQQFSFINQSPQISCNQPVSLQSIQLITTTTANVQSTSINPQATGANNNG
jgi:hypothetical protein